MDNRVQVVAAAGSGKTSVMVARAAYAIRHGVVEPQNVLLLAFNRAAAEELQARVEDRLSAAGVDAAGLKANTFHAFGLAVHRQGDRPQAAARGVARRRPGRRGWWAASSTSSGTATPASGSRGTCTASCSPG